MYAQIVCTVCGEQLEGNEPCYRCFEKEREEDQIRDQEREEDYQLEREELEWIEWEEDVARWEDEEHKERERFDAGSE